VPVTKSELDSRLRGSDGEGAMTSPLLQAMIEAALAAGDEIERIYAEGCAAEEKLDGSPVTIADRHAELIILERLTRAFPDIPILAEEEACAGRIPELGRRFFCVDPLDGTRGFVERNGEFTVNIALVDDGTAAAGVIYAPDPRLLYYGARGEGAFRVVHKAEPESIRVRPAPAGGLTGVGSRNHPAPGTEERNARLGIADYLPSGSSLKFCRLAEGAADVYPRYGRTMEWDTAAGQAILEAAGGRVMALDGIAEAGPLAYGKVREGFANPHFIAWGGN
jgi:3'(2'), 5'-bisphosphate nucleotidase